MADYDMGLCQNLSKMSISDERRSTFTGSSLFPGFSGSINLHGCNGFDQDTFLEVSSRRREGLVQSSHGQFSIGDGGDSHRLRLLGLQDFPNPNHRVFTENRAYLLEQINHQSRQDVPLVPEKSRLDFQEIRGNRIFKPLSAMTNSSFKEDLPLNLASMVEIFGSVYLMAKDKMGCGILQRLIEGESFLDSMFIFKEVINHVAELGMDPFGNFFIQKLLQVCNEEQRTQIVIMLTSKPGLLVKISLSNYGKRVVQKLIETVSTKTQINLVKSALKPGLLYLVRDFNGNRVIGKCLKYLGPDDNKFVIEAITKFCAEIATHRHGCCVLRQCLKYSVGEQREKLDMGQIYPRATLSN